jgi:hypothetical protein
MDRPVKATGNHSGKFQGNRYLHGRSLDDNGRQEIAIPRGKAQTLQGPPSLADLAVFQALLLPLDQGAAVRLA